MRLAGVLRELDEQEEQLLELRLAKTITATVLDRKAKAIHARRFQVEAAMQSVRDERAAVARRVTESEQVRELLATLRQEAERTDETQRHEIVRAVVRQIVVRRSGDTTRAHVTYKFVPTVSRTAVMNRLSFTAYTNASGTASRHRSNVARSGCR